MSDKCQVCGMEFDGEYIEFNKERSKDVYKCYACNGVNMFPVPKAVKREKKASKKLSKFTDEV